ncbi:hypothetical protein RN001_005048 [Aquatica leii]|uniref:BRCT domain-containing protein n=1 Tax=Aquatica leii TaxID=1421715 RepID=A0AAN7SIK8_9COLE|nr:hypothetical protein RN001_005048 [Aquatica leii]
MDHNNVKIIFVVPSSCDSPNETSALMQQAFDACKQNSVDCEWYTEEQCLDYQSLKTDFFIFQEFNGETFEKIKSSKSAILGPLCLLTCLTEGKNIPNFSWPIYSVAMLGCTVAFSTLSKLEKREMQEKVEYMGGYVSSCLVESCTHLVTNSVKSEKYIKAAEAGKKIMLNSWVTDVWDVSLKANVHSTNEQFNKHICPVFYNLLVCCTGLSNVQRNELSKLITDNGGKYKEQLYLNKTDIMIAESRNKSVKYKAAVKHNIKCVTMMWVIDSIKSGYALPDSRYQVRIGTSTPTKDGEELPNFSMISTIGNASELPLRHGVEFLETINATEMANSLMKDTPSMKRKSNSNEHNELVDEINLKEVKKAGAFLDGCGVYLVGFGTEQREKLCKILNLSGATRYNDVSERVTHVLVGDENCVELKYLRSKDIMSACPIVSIHWLLASLNEESPVDEERFLISKSSNVGNEPSSPLSKKSLHLLHAVPEIVVDKDVSIPSSYPAAEMDIIQQYLQPNTTDKEDTLAKLLSENTNFNTKQNEELSVDKARSKVSVRSEKDLSLSSAIDDDSSQLREPIFEGLKFLIDGFIQEERNRVKLAIEEMSGTVVPKTYKGVCDYAVVPTFSSILKRTATCVVNDLWITECWHENELRPVEYFHQPISVDEKAEPLKGCILTISIYNNYERTFLKSLIVLLGGVYQDLLSRIETNNLKACTHLVTPEASGKKYLAAIKWGLPVVNKDWLLECAHVSKYAPETSFLVGESKRKSASALTNASVFNTSNRKIPVTSSKVINPNPPEAVEEQKEPTIKVPINQFSNTPPHKDSSDTEDQTPTRTWNRATASQITPVQKIIAAARIKKLLGTPGQSLQKPSEWDHVNTPDTPLKTFINPTPSPSFKKQMCRFLNTFPDYKPRRNSTPLSELKRKFWDNVGLPKDDNVPDLPNFDLTVENDVSKSGESLERISTPPSTKINSSDNLVNNQLKQLQEMLTASGGNRSDSRRSSLLPPAGNFTFVSVTELKDSQPNTVGWDECIEEEEEQEMRVFMFSGVDQEKRGVYISELEKLGATVSNSPNFDPASTHLICSKPNRNEKILASLSAGKWILHESYVEQCALQGKFVDEELFEFGNPKSNDNIYMKSEKENDNQLKYVHFWRKEVTRRGYGAFHDMRLIVVANRRDLFIRVLQAGGGMVIDESPPFTKTIHATHCLLDLKYVSNFSDYIPLAQQGVYCVNTLYVNDFLLKNGIDVRDYIVPYLLEYYES